MFYTPTYLRVLHECVMTLAASSEKHNVTVWRPSARLSVQSAYSPWGICDACANAGDGLKNLALLDFSIAFSLTLSTAVHAFDGVSENPTLLCVRVTSGT